ncbi:acetyl-CoA synthetase-like protein [Backusella circina FSU 941]|nr:acetyl-CoA synthetase-like protein [Backusella circina FSU 941]
MVPVPTTFSTNVQFNDEKLITGQFKAFINFLDHQTQKYSTKACLRYCSPKDDVPDYKTLSYAQVDRIVTNLACEWSDQIKDNQVVALIAGHSVSYYVTLLALFRLRVTPLCISPRNSEAAIINLLEKTNCKLAFTTELFEEHTRTSASQVDGVETFVTPEFDLEKLGNDPINPNADTIIDTDFSDSDITKAALILHSSGSTSLPKPIFISNRYLFNLCRVFHVRINHKGYADSISENDNLLCSTPFFHIYGLFSVFSIVTLGGCAVFLDNLPTSTEKIMFGLTQNKCSVMCVTPYILEQMRDYVTETQDYSAVKALKYICYAGAPLKFETGQWFQERGVNVRNIYGMTEFTTCMTSDFNPKNKKWDSVAPFDYDANGEPYLQFEIVDPEQPEIKHLYARGDAPFLANYIANRPDGGFDTNDLFTEDPENPGHYIYYGRKDDILVMENGEKTNPVPMESTIRQFPVIDQVAVIGHGRQCTAALICLNEDHALDLSPDEMIAEVHEAINAANKDCPNFSKIVPQMVKILPLRKKLPTTDKGTVMRKKAEIFYKDIVEKLYKDFMEGPSHTKPQDVSTWTMNRTKHYLAENIASVLQLPLSTFDDGSKCLFDLGLDSLTCIQFRNRISEYFENVAQNFIFQHRTIDSMAEALMSKNVEGNEEQMKQRYEQTQKMAEEYIQRANKDFRIAKNSYDENKPKVIFLTGATGSLGSFMLRDLLKDPTVKKVYCAVRGKEDQLFNRLVEAFASRSLDVSLLEDTDRVEALPMKFNEPYLGFGKDHYEKLQDEVTIIQHCAWLLDFNLPVDHFDKECISPFYNLLKFAYKDVNPMHVHFISSVSASAGLAEEIEETPIPFDSHITMPMGYAQSKFIIEILFNYLCTEKNMPCYIERLGQVCGDSENGVWNTSEQYPLMFVGGGSKMHKMPGLDTKIDWITVDHAAAAIVSIMLRTANLPANCEESIYHIVNPHPIHWSDVLDAMKASGMTFDIICPAQWVMELSKDDTNPAFRLMSFYEDNFKNSFKMPIWKTEKTVRIAPILEKSPVLDTSLFTKFIGHWKSVGFYNSSV